MFFKLFFQGHKWSRRLFIFSTCALTFSSIVHWGIIKPFQSHQNAEHLEGSNPLLQKNRGDPNYEDLSSVNWTDHLNSVYDDLPSVYPNLTLQHAKFNDSNLNSEFNSFIRDDILSDSQKIEVNDPKYTVFNDFRKIRKLDFISQFSHVSLVEIPYKSYFYNQQTRLLTKSHIIKDLIMSLAAEAEFNKTSIRPDSIKIDFQLEKVNVEDEELDKRSFPLKANKVHELNISFRVYNPNNYVNYVFKSIPIQPYRETQFNIFLKKAELRPIAPIAQISWSLFPIEDSKFEISMEDVYPKFEVYKYSVPSLSLIFETSQWLKKLPNTKVSNLPTFNDFYKLSIPYLSNITKEQIKKDIEIFHGSLFAWNMRLLIQDIQTLISIMTTKNLETPQGAQSSLERILSDKSFRYGLYKFLYFDDKTKNAAEQSLGSGAVSVEGMTAFLQNMNNVLEDIITATSISIEWHEEPKLSSPVAGDSSQFPSVSFSFSRTIKWNKKIIFPFSGCWSVSDGKGSYSISNSSNCKGEGKQFFNFYSLFEGKLSSIFKDLLGDAQGLGLIPDAEQFVKIDCLEIEKDESITARFTAKNSPMAFALYSSIDTSSKYQAFPGWKALDISASYDLSKFYKFFYKIYEKINNFEDKKNGIYLNSFWSAASSVGKISSLLKPDSKDVKEKGISIAVHLINHLFDSSGEKVPDEKRPFSVFFKTLLSEPFKFDSTQFMCGWSTSMLDLKASQIFSKNTAKLSDDWQSKENLDASQNPKDRWNYPIKFKNKKMEKLSESYRKNYSVFYPKPPIIFSVFDFGKNDQWNSFLQHQGSTNIGFVFYKDEIKGILRDFLDEEFVKQDSPQTFPYTGFFDWNKVKVSVVRLKLAQALKSVLSLKYTSLATLVDSYLGWSRMSLQHMFGEFIQRDCMVVLVNMMSADCAINALLPKSLLSISDSSLSVLTLAVKPSFKPDLLSDDFRKSFIGKQLKF